jgi:glycosyltransferase involved in cell wall biosynthesis
MKISLVIPYRNEEKKIIYTFNQILNQTHTPDEVIFVNSSSTDNSFKLVNKLIKKNKRKIRFKNLNTNSSTPSMSKNIGIKKSRNKWVAFMDIDLKFSKHWLKSLANLIKKEKIQCAIGLCKFTGKNSFDAAAICQTRGYATYHEAIPSSIFEKKIFKKYGYFKNLRAGYDRQYINKIKKKIKYKINYKNNIEYKNNSIAKNYTELFDKIISYTYASLSIDYRFKSFLIIVGLILFIYLLIINFKLSIYSFLFYILIRGYVFPFIKCENLSFIKKFPSSILLLPLTSTIIDFARVIAILKKIFNNIYKKI